MRRQESQWGLFAFVITAAIVYVVSYYAFAFDYSGVRSGRFTFLDAPAYRIWHGMVAGQVTLWLLLIRVSAETWCRLVPDSRAERLTALAVTVALLGVTFWAAIQTPASTIAALHAASPLPQHCAKVLFFVGVGLLVGSVPVFGLAGAWMKMRHMEPTDIRGFVEVRVAVHRMVTMLGVMIGATVVTTGALFQATNVAIADPKGAAYGLPPLSKDFVVAYGLTFFAFTLLVYLPVHGGLLRAADRIRKRLELDSPRSRPGSREAIAELREWQINRKALDEHLGMGMSAFGSLQAAVAVMAPLLATLPTLVVGK